MAPLSLTSSSGSPSRPFPSNKNRQAASGTDGPSDNRNHNAKIPKNDDATGADNLNDNYYRSNNDEQKTHRRRPLQSNNNNNKSSSSGVLGIIGVLRVVVLASAIIFVFVCLLQSQHMKVKEDGRMDLKYHPGIDGDKWKVPGNAAAVAVAVADGLTTGESRGNGIIDIGSVPIAPYQVSPMLNAVNEEAKNSMPLPAYDYPSTGHSFQPEEFQQKLSQWRHETDRIQRRSYLAGQKKMLPYHEQQQMQQQHANKHNRFLTQQQSKKKAVERLSIPFMEQQVLFKSRNTWHLMVVILADDCFPHRLDKDHPNNSFPALGTIKDALQTDHADIVVYLPQQPQSTMFPVASGNAKLLHQTCQSKLTAILQSQYEDEIDSGKLQLVFGVVNPLAPRIEFDFHVKTSELLADYHKTKAETNYTIEQEKEFFLKARRKCEREQLRLEFDYSLGLDLAYLSELVFQYGDLMFILHSGTRLLPKYRVANKNGVANNSTTAAAVVAVDYGQKIVEQYELSQLRPQKDLLVRRFCYMSFMEQDQWLQLPTGNLTIDDAPPRYQSKLDLPTGIVMEQHGLYRFSMVLRSLLPYHKTTPTGLMMQYCKELLWESQIVQPIGPNIDLNGTEESEFPPALWYDATTQKDKKADLIAAPEVNPTLVQQIEHEQQRQQQTSSHLRVPPWVTVDNSQLGPQRDVTFNDVVEVPRRNDTALPKQKVTFVVPSATRPNGIKNQYVTFSLNQLFPLIRRDFLKADGSFDASVLLVICGNTQDELDDHQNGLLEYYGPEIKEGIVKIVSTNLETYPTLHNLPDNYGDPENRLRWRSKQNLDISSSFFAAKGKSEYVMLLEDDTGYRDKFTTTLKAMLNADTRNEESSTTNKAIALDAAAAHKETFRKHDFAQIHFGFGYSGVLIHDDDVLVYAVMHYVLMDEKPCDLLYLANYLQGQVLDQKFRWQLKRVLITHLGSVSSLKGKFQPVWGLKG